MKLSSPNVIMAMLNLKFSVLSMNCRCGDRICQLVKENDLEHLEDRGGHPRKECFQVSASTFKSKPMKVGKSDVCNDRRDQQLLLIVTLGDIVVSQSTMNVAS
jgi:hypothetical protein